jgi:hypothetical protein
MNTKNQFKSSVSDIELDDLLNSGFNVVIQYVGNKRWRYQVGLKGNWVSSSTYGSAKDAEKALEADVNEIVDTLNSKAGKPE